MINYKDTITLENGHVAIVLTNESVKLVTPETEQTEGGAPVVDTAQMQLAMAITLLVMSDKEWITETMDKFEDQMRSMPPVAKH